MVEEYFLDDTRHVDLDSIDSFSCDNSNVSLDDRKIALLQMSLNAARNKHSLKDILYDETQSMNIINDIRLITLYVGIPIGSE